MNYNQMANLLMRQDESRLQQKRIEAQKTDPKALALIAASVNAKIITRRQGKELVETLYPSNDQKPEVVRSVRERATTRYKAQTPRNVAWKTA
jgi:Asp-tRNA(Asn)/Glu-tRNA(Gln) amidotransferase B subunit